MNDSLAQRASRNLVERALFGPGRMASGLENFTGFLRPEVKMGLDDVGLQQQPYRRDERDKTVRAA